MTYTSYTQKIVLKNSQESLKSADLKLENGVITGFSPLNHMYEQIGLDHPNRLELICPGFINLHSHLAYTDLKLDEEDLFSWIRALMKKSAELNIASSTVNGAKEAIASGTTFLVDNTSHLNESIEAFEKTGLKGLIGLEVFGSDPKQADEIFKKAISVIASLPAKQSTNRHTSLVVMSKAITITLSPHAPYDVSPLLWEKCAKWCEENKKPLLSHIAESKEETKWFQKMEATNALRLWDSLGVSEAKKDNWQKASSSTQHLNNNSLLETPSIFTHGIELSDEDLETLKKKNISLVTCPRSNKYLKNGKADIKKWQKEKIPFGIGTDSKASNYDLDLRNEVNELDLSAKEKFELLTQKAADILNLGNSIGSLDIGKAADYTVFEIDLSDHKEIDINSVDPLELVFRTDICKVKEVFISGKSVYRNESSCLQS